MIDLKLAKYGPALLLSLGLFGPIRADAPSQAQISASPPLAVTIAVPEQSNQVQNGIVQEGQRYLSLSSKSPHFYVVLTNVSNHPVSIYAEDGMWGFYNLTLEITAIGGKALDKPLVVTRAWGMGSWFRNRSDTETLQPGDTIVRDLHVEDKPDTALEDGTYRPFPLKDPDGNPLQIVRMRAVFTEKEDDKFARSSVWSGEAASQPQDYRVDLFGPNPTPTTTGG